MKVLILGATSFAGSYFIKHALDQGIEVVGVSRSHEYDDLFLPYANRINRADYKFVQLDVRTQPKRLQALISRYKPSIIVDFAGQGMVAQSWEAPYQWYETNVVAKSKLINFLRGCDYLDRYVRVSTPEVYGSTDEPVDECAPYNPSTPYSVSHAAIDMHLEAYFSQYEFPVITTRFANFYGAHQQLYRLAPKIFFCGLAGKKFFLDGGGTSVRAFIHGKDVAEGLWATIQKGIPGQKYHFSTSEHISISNFVKKSLSICKVPFNDLVESSPERLGKDAAYLMDSRRSNIELGWAPNISLEQGMVNVHKWVRDNLEEIGQRTMTYQHKR